MAFNRLPGRIDETEDAIAALAEVGPSGLTALVSLANDTGEQVEALVNNFTADQLEAIASISEGEYEAIATALGSPADLTDDVGGSGGIAADSGDAGTDTLIENIRVRLNEVVAVLSAIGLIDDQPDA